ncbi:sugar transferase, partial [Candidatus Curtissbacteria bacterium]|nr:sugar transferase [Candidatus Curtissbacteria bacterium]
MIYDFLKRSLDIAGSLVALIVFSPIIVLVAIAIKLTSSGPILYVPERAGKDGKLFRMLKFRSMSMYQFKRKEVHAEKYLEMHPKLKAQYQRSSYKLAEDPRVTPLGKIIRKFSLDELPQLINVLKGD